LVLAQRNRYLITRSGTFVGTRILAAVFTFGGLLGAPVLGALGMAIGAALNSPAVVGISLLLAFVAFVGTTIMMWVFLLRGGSAVRRGAQALGHGDPVTAVALAQRPLLLVFRSDIRTRALYVIGLAAEANADFPESEDLFRRAVEALPAMATSKWKRYSRCLMLCHRAIALVALRRLDEADVCVREATDLFPRRPDGALDAFMNDEAFGAIGINTSLRDIENGRDPRGLLTLACALVLSARGMGREALDLINREEWALKTGLHHREQVLLAHVQVHAQARLAGAPMRAGGLAAPVDPWAERVLPMHA
jgi:hypothetical protein